MLIAFRVVGSILAGVALALVLVIAVELASSVVHPVPPGFTGTKDEMGRHVERYPHWVLALVVAAWGGTAFVSTWLTGRIGNRGGAAFVGLIMLAAVAFNISMLPYTMWFKVVILVAVPAAIDLGIRSASRRKPTAVISASQA